MSARPNTRFKSVGFRRVCGNAYRCNSTTGFFDLPGELRNEIYHLVFPDFLKSVSRVAEAVPPTMIKWKLQPTSQALLESDTVEHLDCHDERSDEIAWDGNEEDHVQIMLEGKKAEGNYSKSLLQVCKTIRIEAMPFFYGSNQHQRRFSFTSEIDFHDYITTLDPLARDLIRDVNVDIPTPVMARCGKSNCAILGAVRPVSDAKQFSFAAVRARPPSKNGTKFAEAMENVDELIKSIKENDKMKIEARASARELESAYPENRSETSSNSAAALQQNTAITLSPDRAAASSTSSQSNSHSSQSNSTSIDEIPPTSNAKLKRANDSTNNPPQPAKKARSLDTRHSTHQIPKPTRTVLHVPVEDAEAESQGQTEEDRLHHDDDVCALMEGIENLRIR
ncbi:MAG: hypothetical protein Q9227_008881 [Pyrenula ochraceoflavens]